MAIKLGSKVKDSITGFEGVAIGRTEWLYGCVRIGVQPSELHDGKPIDSVWFDEQQLNVVVEQEPVVSKDSSAKAGGPQCDPVRPVGQ